jgi:penicillin-insensitive murein DD-endopeptidase
MRWLALAALAAGCAELGVITDGTSLSVGQPNRGYLLEGVRIPDRGEGFVTREVWRMRDNRFGTDELIDLLTAVGRRMHVHARDVRLVVADLSGRGGGEQLAFHRSHQSGRDVDLLYYARDASGKPFEPEAMQAFNAAGRATDGSGVTLDVPRTWLLVKELLTAPEAMVQWVFMYEPIAKRLVEHAESLGEPAWLVARARKAMRQPSASARHDDHMHVRVYCSATDRAYGCVDIGPMELLAEREAETSPVHQLLGTLATTPPAVAHPPVAPSGASVAASTASASGAAGAPGATVAAGAMSAVGAAGAAGAMGAAGAAIAVGVAGGAVGAVTAGAAGAVGMAGAAGTTGAAGTAGAAGAAAVAPVPAATVLPLGRLLRTPTDRILRRGWR